MSQNRPKQGYILVVILSGIAVLLAVMQLLSALNSMAVYNLIRAIVFALSCLYLHRNPTRVDFLGPLGIQNEGNAGERNIKISYFMAYLFSAVNLAISTALYFDP